MSEPPRKQNLACVRGQSKPVGRRKAKKNPKAAASGTDSPEESVTTFSGRFDSSFREDTSLFYSPGLEDDVGATYFAGRTPEPASSPSLPTTLDQTHAETPPVDTALQDPVDLSAMTTNWFRPKLSFMVPTTGNENVDNAGVDLNTEASFPQHSTMNCHNNRFLCNCLESLVFALRDHHTGMLARESIHDTLCLNKDSLAAVARFLDCKAHFAAGSSDSGTLIAAYALLSSVLATFTYALSMRGDSLFHIGAYIVDGEDGEELRRRIILIGIKRMKKILGQLEMGIEQQRQHQRHVPVTVGGCWIPPSIDSSDFGFCDGFAFRLVCGAIHRSLLRDVDYLLKEIEGDI